MFNFDLNISWKIEGSINEQLNEKESYYSRFILTEKTLFLIVDSLGMKRIKNIKRLAMTIKQFKSKIQICLDLALKHKLNPRFYAEGSQIYVNFYSEADEIKGPDFNVNLIRSDWSKAKCLGLRSMRGGTK